MTEVTNAISLMALLLSRAQLLQFLCEQGCTGEHCDGFLYIASS